MRKLILLLITSFLFFNFSFDANAQEKQIYYFYGTGCPHCANVDQYFLENGFYKKYPIQKYDVYFDRDASVLYNETLDSLNYPKTSRGVPAIVVGETVFVGDKPIIDGFEAAAYSYLESGNVPSSLEVNKSESSLTLPLVIGASIVDAINPCAFAVLIILMTTVIARGGGRKALKSGVAFSVSIFISYFLMGLGLFKAIELGGFSGGVFKIVGWLAIALGILNLKDYLWYGKGFLMEVPMSWRPKLKSSIQSVTSPMGAFFTGFLVSLFLLPCTSGPYIVILGMLAKNPLDTTALLYLVLYNLIFVAPMIAISVAVYKGFDPKKAETERQKRLKLLHLIAGIIMILMGMFILVGYV